MPTGPRQARLLAMPENRAALAAIRDVLHAVTSASSQDVPNPLFVHGPSGAGKSFLLEMLKRELTRASFEALVVSANDFADQADFTLERGADVLVIEDLQHLPLRFVNALITVIDDRLRHDLPMVFTATEGPSRLTHRGTVLPRRLTNRLAGGLVVRIEPMQKNSRRRLLEITVDEASMRVAPEVLDWLAENLTGGGRQLQGAVRQLKSLQRLQRTTLSVADVGDHFRTQTPSVQRITEQVSACFQVPPRRLMSARRSHDVLLPRQVSMYLARRLTTLSLVEIGDYFGGRDHKTVRHACNKVEAALKTDAALSSTVRQLHAELA